MNVRTKSPTTALLAILVATPFAAAAAISNATDGPAVGLTVDTGYAIVQLKGDPLTTAAQSKPPKGRKIDFDSATVKSYRALLAAQRNDYKQWLRANAPAAKITGEYDISLNAVAVKLNGETLATVAGAPQVQAAQYQGLYYPLTDPDLELIHAPEAWQAGGVAADAGQGVKVAIVDTGIDVTHPCFDDAGYAPQAQLGDARFTNNKVIAAKVFNNKTPSRHYTAEALQAHGTHVAGTAACNGTPASVDGVTIPQGVTGVAPRALLGNYNVFPGSVLNARSEDILNALDAAYADGFDVANMSLGGGASGIQDLLTIAVDNLDQGGMVVAVAAGNSGPGLFTIESPGSAARALTAGAATVGHFVASPITAGGNMYPGIEGDFGSLTADLTAQLAAVPGPGANGLSLACAPLGVSLSGQIAMVARGTCSFSTKIRNAQSAGAVAVIVSNNVSGDAIPMGQDGTANQPTLPAFMVSRSDGAPVAAENGTSVTIGAGKAYFVTGNDDFMSSFSSQGPTDVDFRVKPDVVAPGQNVLSSIPHQFCPTPPCFAFFQGTSMATPHLAGSAAVVEWAHPTWSSAQVRSAIVNAADEGTLKTASTTPVPPLATNVNIIGAGRENLLSAVDAKVALDPVSVSFGAIPSGSGQTQTFDVEVSDLTGGGGSYAVAVSPGSGGVAYSVSPSSISLAPNGSATVTVTMAAEKGAAFGGHQGRLTIGTAAHAAVFTLIK